MPRLVARLAVLLVAGVTAIAVTPGAPATAGPFRATQPVTAAVAAAEPEPYTRIVLRPAVADRLANAGIRLAAINRAEAYRYRDTTAIDFPLTWVGPAGDRVRHSGALVLRRGGDGINMRRLWLNLDRDIISVLVDGDYYSGLFNLSRPSGRPGLGPVRLRLAPIAVNSINRAFGQRVFTTGESFGFATLGG